MKRIRYHKADEDCMVSEDIDTDRGPMYVRWYPKSNLFHVVNSEERVSESFIAPSSIKGKKDAKAILVAMGAKFDDESRSKKKDLDDNF